MIDVVEKIRNKISFDRFKELVWLLCGNLFSMVIGFFIMKYMTQMGTIDFGKYSLVLSIAYLFSSVTYGPIEQSLLRFYHDSVQNKTTKSYINVHNKIFIVIGLIIFLAGIIYYYINSVANDWKEIMLICLYIVVFSSTGIYNSLMNLIRQRKLNASLQVFEKALILAMIILLFNANYLHFNFVLIALLSGTLIFLIIKYRVISKLIPNDGLKDCINESYEKDTLRTLFFYCMPFMVWGIMAWFQSNSEKWIILHFVNTKQVGIYSLLTIIANYLITTPMGIINQFIQPILFDRVSKLTKLEALNEVINLNRLLIFFLFILTLIAFVVSYLFENAFVRFIASDSFVTDYKILPFVCLGIGLFSMAQVLANVGIILKDPGIYLMPKILSGIMSLVLNYFFIQYFGLRGIFVSLLITSLFYLFFMFLVNRRVIKILTN